MLKYVTIAMILGQLSTMSCAPTRAKALRESRPLTLGYPGAAYRPAGMVDVGVKYNFGYEEKNTVEREEKDATGNSELDKREVTTQRSGAPEVFTRLYPWETSAFYVGLGYRQGKQTSTYSALKSGSLSLTENPHEIKYESTTNVYRLPFGWAWIWENGFSLGFDVGIASYKSHNGKTSASGEGEYDATDAKWIQTAVDDSNNGVRLFDVGLGIIGYSF